ncbi:cytochrome b [Marinicellulosiphila megalodicopiae]|uniref:cytochrome b n=1 Tax=Marinicellulosiphila megalodicopiae TaxID=2724896 RepID=UPI003BB2067F
MSEKNSIMQWVDARLPVTSAYEKHMSKYYAPKNFNFWYIFGILAMVVLVNQILTGVWLTMFFDPTPAGGPESLEYIRREVPMGWLIQALHAVGASMFFIVIYMHMFRGVMYGSYQKPRELIWVFGMAIYLILMAEGFMGYVIPWGQMSFWGAKVIVSLVGALPLIGDDLVVWVQGDYIPSGATQTRFFSLHVIALPLVLCLLVFLHILALHEVGSNNPDGIDIKKTLDKDGVPVDGIPFHPYYTLGKDMVGLIVFLIIFLGCVFFFPEGGGYFLEHANFEPANPLKTPEHIAPTWYFGTFYSILRAITFDIGPIGSKLAGVIFMGAAIAILFVLPWLDRSPVRSWRYKGWISKVAIILFAIAFVTLMKLGTMPATKGATYLAQGCTVIYFLFFLAMPWYTKYEKCKPVPDRVTK